MQNKLLTGFKNSDEYIDLKTSDLIILAGAYLNGLRTDLVFNIATNVVEQNNSVLLFSLDLSKKQIMQRYKLDNLIIDDTPAISIEQIEEKCRIMKQTHNVKLVIIDYFQLIKSKDYSSEKICIELKRIAKRFNIGILVTFQLSTKRVEVEKEVVSLAIINPPKIKDITDTIIYLYPKSHISKNLVEIVVAKGNNEKSGKVILQYDDNNFKFKEKDFENEK